MAALLAIHAALGTRFGGALPPRRNHKVHLLAPALFDLVSDPRITGPVAEVLGPDLLCWGSSFFAKPPHDPGFISWHQDAAYWGLSSNEVVTAWVALTPSRRENGCLKVVPGSHRRVFAHVETGAPDNMLSRGQEVAVAVDEAEAVAVELSPGQFSLHHVLIVHGSAPNRSDVPRIGFAVRYVPTAIKQVDRPQASATPAAGVDRYRHFLAERRPAVLADAEALDEHDRALSLEDTPMYRKVP